MLVRASLVTVGAALLTLVPAAAYPWPSDPTVNLPVCAATTNQTEQATTPDGAGGVFIAWTDPRNGNSDIFVQRISAQGEALWTVNGVALCVATGAQLLPVIARDGTGGAVVAWVDQRAVPAQVYYRHVTGLGVPQGAADGSLVSGAAFIQSRPAIAYLGGNNYVVAFEENNDIRARIFGTGGGTGTVCAATGQQQYPAVAADGAGGAYVAWQDRRNVNADVFAQRLNTNATPQWAVDGVGLCIGTQTQERPAIAADATGLVVAFTNSGAGGDGPVVRMVTPAGVQFGSCGELFTGPTDPEYLRVAMDGAGGAYVCWMSTLGTDTTRIQRVGPAGTALWTSGGLPVAPGVSGSVSTIRASLVPDGEGGVIVAWEDSRSTGSIYGQRYLPSGATRWGSQGMVISRASGTQQYPVLAGDGLGGAIAVWRDGRNASTDLYAQRIFWFGFLGAAPTITSVEDAPNDQGGRIRLRWNASMLDTFPAIGIETYGVWREIGGSAAKAKLARGAALAADGEPARPGLLRRSGPETDVAWWEGLGSVPARGEPDYAFFALTTGDSTAAGIPYQRFLVDAHAREYPVYWDSDPMTGWSVDNLAPAPPAPFTGEYAGGVATLAWGANLEADFAYYTLHRGATSDFTPAPGNLVIAQTTTGHVDAAGTPLYYKLAAVDANGNVSPYALVFPDGTVGVEPGAPRELWLAPPAPNPSARGASFRFALPAALPARLALYDQQGRRVRVLLDQLLPAGEHEARWDGADASGRPVRSGLYFSSLEAGGRTLRARVIVIR